MGSKRALLAAALAAGSVVGITSAVPVGAAISTGQARPAVISRNEPVPGASQNVSLVSHLAPGKTVGDTTPAGQYAALAIAGNCAYIGRRNYNSTDNADNGLGVQVVDISNPAAPVYKGDIPGSGFTDSTARELRAVDQYHLLVVLHYSRYTGGGVNEGGQQIDGQTVPGASSGGHNILQAFHLNPDCSATPVAQYDMGAVKPHEFYLWLDPQRPGRVIAFVTTPFGPPQMEVVDFSSCTGVGAYKGQACSPDLVTVWLGLYPQPNTAAIDNSGIGNYLHSLSVAPDGKTAFMADWNAGFFTVDTSQIAANLPHPVIVGETATSLRDDWSHQNGPTGQGGDAHSAVWIPATIDRTSIKPYVVLTDEDYLGIGDCPFGWMRIDRVDRLPGGVTRPTPISSFGLPENTLVQEAAELTFASRPNALLTDPNSCAGYDRDHPGYIAASKAWPGGQVPANAYTSHNPTPLPDLVLTTWYGGGFRVVDIANPASPKETGFFVPNPEPVVREEVDDAAGQYLSCYYPITPTATDPSNCTTRQGTMQNSVNYTAHPKVAGWSYPIIKDGLIYFVDNRNGLYVVSYSGPFANEVSRTHFAEGNSNNRGLPVGATGTTGPSLPLGQGVAARPDTAGTGRVSPAAGGGALVGPVTIAAASSAAHIGLPLVVGAALLLAALIAFAVTSLAARAGRRR